MSRINELKAQYKESAISKLDIYKLIVPNQANKYAELFARIYKSRLSTHTEKDRLIHEFINEIPNLNKEYLNKEYLETLSHAEIIEMFKVISDFGWEDVRNILKFCSLNERNLIDNKDITSYTTLNQLYNAVNIAELKLLDKEAQKSVYKVFEDDTWIVIRPLTIEASAAYGASTKWCTTMIGKDYFNRYCKRGALLYNINKQTGYKVACFKNYDPDYDSEFSFWNTTDSRIDSLDSDLPGYIMEIIRDEVKKEIRNSELEGFKFSSTEREKFESVPIEAPIPVYPPEALDMVLRNIDTEPTQMYVEGNMEVNGDLTVRGEIRIAPTPTEEGHIPVASRDAFNQAIAEHLQQVQERAETERAQQSQLLESIDLGTLTEEYKRRLQMLAGINPDNQPVEEQVEQAEQPDVSSTPTKTNWFKRLLRL